MNMVENKSSVYDESSAPFAEATPTAVPEGDLLMLDATSVEAEATVDAATTPCTTGQVDNALVADPPSEEDIHRSRKLGAGVASGVFGLLIGGPFLGLIFGFGAAYAADREGAAGDTARAVGDVAMSAKEKAKEIDEKHHVVDKSKVMASDAWKKAQELDQQHRILDRTREFLVVSWTALAAFAREHHVVERGVEGVGKLLYWLSERISQRMDRREQVPTRDPDEQTTTKS